MTQASAQTAFAAVVPEADRLFGGAAPDGALLERLCVDGLRVAVPRMLAWTRRPHEALPEREHAAPGYRDVQIDAHGQVRWVWPRSNQAERITVWLHAHRLDPGGKWLALAQRYADAMLNDPVRGICQPDSGRRDQAPAEGMVWYWRDVDAWMTNYTMRVPPAMLDLYEVTAAPRYRTAAILAGEAMLRLTQPETGLPLEGWATPGPQSQRWVSNHKINSRVGYATYTYARLFHHTGDRRYLAALENLVHALRAVQRNDGAVPDELAVKTQQAVSPIIKGHFLGYILNGSAAALRLLPDCLPLRTLALGVAHYLLDATRRVGAVLYGDLDDQTRSEHAIWRTSHADAAGGFLDLHAVTGDPRFRAAAHRQLLQAAVSTICQPQHPDLHGGVPTWLGPASNPGLGIGGYFHFYTLQAALAVQTHRDSPST